MKKDIFKQKIDNHVIIMGIGSIAMLMAFAMFLGMNGLLLTFAIGTIAAAVGVAIPTPKIMKK